MFCSTFTFPPADAARLAAVCRMSHVVDRDALEGLVDELRAADSGNEPSPPVIGVRLVHDAISEHESIVVLPSH
ncbi:hypothetical protein [Agreia sp. COWG]|uniref:hypothetical protein n=1 Tax=Agreia sp. COWG TaxID=2773266 RepID=UPI0019285E84|nr:hypothetical protein [Agreia sp. COWG]